MEEKPYQVQSDTTTGHHLVASRNIEAGAMILQEEPLVVGPTKKNIEVCCPKCRLPMCGKPDCWAEGSPHARGECSEMAKAGRPSSITINHWPDKMYLGILAMRCAVLRDREPEKWKKLIQLKLVNCGQISTWTSELESSVMSTLAELVTDPTTSRDWMANLIRVFFINSYELPALEGIRCEGLRALYFMASLIGRNCGVVNATETFAKDGQILIKATVPITKGSKIILN